MTFPALAPTSRSFDAGDFPVRTFRAQDGAEVRLLYGNKRVGMRIQLSYDNIPDASARLFLEHYHQMKGTYEQFDLVPEAKQGWTEDRKWLGAAEWGSRWRYAGPPQINGVYPGVSTVRVELVAATV